MHFLHREGEAVKRGLRAGNDEGFQVMQVMAGTRKQNKDIRE